MTMITPSYLGETIEYSSLHACRSTLEDPTSPSRAPRRRTRIRPPLPHRHSWPSSSDARHGARGDRHGRDLRSAGRSGSRADSSLRRATVSRIYRYRRRRPLAPPRKDRGHPIVACCHRRRRHGRGPRQRRWRSGFQPGDRVANVRRLWRRVGGRGSAARGAGQLCAWNIGRQYRQWLWRGLRGLANIARHGGVANLGGSGWARGCFPCYVNRRNRRCPFASTRDTASTSQMRRVEVWRGGCRSSISVCRPFRPAVP